MELKYIKNTKLKVIIVITTFLLGSIILLLSILSMNSINSYNRPTEQTVTPSISNNVEPSLTPTFSPTTPNKEVVFTLKFFPGQEIPVNYETSIPKEYEFSVNASEIIFSNNFKNILIITEEIDGAGIPLLKEEKVYQVNSTLYRFKSSNGVFYYSNYFYNSTSQCKDKFGIENATFGCVSDHLVYDDYLVSAKCLDDNFLNICDQIISDLKLDQRPN